MQRKSELETSEVIKRVSELTSTLLSEGAAPGQLVFSLTSVATDMGLQLNDAPLETITTLLMAVVHEAGDRLGSEEDCDGVEVATEDTEIPAGATVH